VNIVRGTGTTGYSWDTGADRVPQPAGHVVMQRRGRCGNLPLSISAWPVMRVSTFEMPCTIASASPETMAIEMEGA
jgi:hypothetical protein